VIGSIVAGSPAAQAGLAAGDTITAAGGTALSTATTLTGVLNGRHPGDTITVTDRTGRTRTVTVHLGTGPAA